MLEELWTVQELARRAHRTAYTIHLWRANKGLPAVVIPGDQRATIRFVPNDVRKWARSEGIQIAA
jgi:hypothetical protein